MLKQDHCCGGLNRSGAGSLRGGKAAVLSGGGAGRVAKRWHLGRIRESEEQPGKWVKIIAVKGNSESKNLRRQSALHIQDGKETMRPQPRGCSGAEAEMWPERGSRLQGPGEHREGFSSYLQKCCDMTCVCFQRIRVATEGQKSQQETKQRLSQWSRRAAIRK